ncbi:glutathione S-transferase family protein [Sphingomonas sp. BK069]|uniref:glutathione S-transferase family protein n=1 Tax=Sphingomonas sp. BK069 TaxID=2586979 RepID=UPI0016219971|nr:glutathione S-transferase family protein [Sphingomonas sp. BK069]MBB3349729.1 glutathione S-transferase [Sphingomonas sp. BK069]
MKHELFWISGSPYSWRVQLTLAYKGIAYDSHRLDTGKDEHRTPAFLALNSRGKAPVLKTGGSAISESIAIMAFLDRAHPAVPLFGRTAQEVGWIWQQILEFENYLRDLIENGIVRPLLRGEAGHDPEAMRASADRVWEALGGMSRTLSGSPCLVGNDITAADIVALPHIQLLRRVAPRLQPVERGFELDKLAARLPALDDWRVRMEAMRGYDAAYPPHWRIS